MLFFFYDLRFENIGIVFVFLLFNMEINGSLVVDGVGDLLFILIFEVFNFEVYFLIFEILKN